MGRQQPQPLEPPRRKGLALLPAVAVFTTNLSTSWFLLLGLLDLRFISAWIAFLVRAFLCGGEPILLFRVVGF